MRVLVRVMRGLSLRLCDGCNQRPRKGRFHVANLCRIPYESIRTGVGQEKPSRRIEDNRYGRLIIYMNSWLFTRGVDTSLAMSPR